MQGLRNADISVSHIHNRMPLIFNNEEMHKWMEGQNIDELMETVHNLFGKITR